MKYRSLQENEINRELFRDFIRRQVVTKCWRRKNGEWLIKDEPFIDDWTEQDYEVLIECLKRKVGTGGLIYGAFYEEKLKGFVAVLPEIFGGENKYIDLAAIHVSQDMRGTGIGTVLFKEAKRWAKEKGAEKLYISAHSAVESQAFYKRMGCVEAAWYKKEHVEEEPFDCQLEVKL